MLTSETSVMLQWYELYFSTFPERKHIVHDELESLVRIRSKEASAESMALTLHLVNTLRKPVEESSLNGILGQLHELDLSGRAGAVLARYNNNEEIDLAYELRSMADATLRSVGQSTPDTYCDIPIDDLLKEVSNDTGIKFRRIAVLRENVAALQGGASIAVGGRPDKGKTSLLADVLTDWAPQCVEFFGVHRPLLWLCNEGSSKRVVPRLYQAALGKDLNEITALSNAGALVAAYESAIGAPHTYIRVKDAHGMSIPQIEQVIESMNPCVVVYDMMGNVKLGKSSHGGNKADEVEQLWQAGREMAVRHNHILIGTIQISAPGDNMLYPPYTFLKDSQTAVQGATDIILQLGSLNNPEAQVLRGISTPKNKFAMPGKQSYVMSELYFDGPRCRFNDGSPT
jgi:hypothetical protein